MHFLWLLAIQRYWDVACGVRRIDRACNRLLEARVTNSFYGGEDREGIKYLETSMLIKEVYPVDF